MKTPKLQEPREESRGRLRSSGTWFTPARWNSTTLWSLWTTTRPPDFTRITPGNGTQAKSRRLQKL